MRASPSLIIVTVLFLSACAGAAVDQTAAVQTEAFATLNAEVEAAQAEQALQTVEAENAALKATIDAQATEAAAVPPTQAATSTPAEPATVAPSAPSQPVNTPQPTSPPGVAVRFVGTETCNNVRTAFFGVRNTGPETYQSASVAASDPADVELGRSDGNNEFLPSSSACTGAQPTLGPGQEKFLSVRIGPLPAGTNVLARIVVCTEKGMRGNCISHGIQFTP